MLLANALNSPKQICSLFFTVFVPSFNQYAYCPLPWSDFAPPLKNLSNELRVMTIDSYIPWVELSSVDCRVELRRARSAAKVLSEVQKYKFNRVKRLKPILLVTDTRFKILARRRRKKWLTETICVVSGKNSVTDTLSPLFTLHCWVPPSYSRVV